jgi:hypothetical protein
MGVLLYLYIRSSLPGYLLNQLLVCLFCKEKIKTNFKVIQTLLYVSNIGLNTQKYCKPIFIRAREYFARTSLLRIFLVAN